MRFGQEGVKVRPQWMSLKMLMRSSCWSGRGDDSHSVLFTLPPPVLNAGLMSPKSPRWPWQNCLFTGTELAGNYQLHDCGITSCILAAWAVKSGTVITCTAWLC